MNFNLICRFCMGNSSLTPIFPVKKNHEQFTTAIFLITGINVKIDDGLPQKICVECLKQINTSMKFRAQCRNAQEELLNITKSKVIPIKKIYTGKIHLKNCQTNETSSKDNSNKNSEENAKVNDNMQNINNDAIVNNKKPVQCLVKQSRNDILKKSAVVSVNVESDRNELVNNMENCFNDKQSVEVIETAKQKNIIMGISSDLVLEEEFKNNKTRNTSVDENNDSVSSTIKILKTKKTKASENENKIQNNKEKGVENITDNMSEPTTGVQELLKPIEIPGVNYSVNTISKTVKTKENETFVGNNKVQNEVVEAKNCTDNPSVHKRFNATDISGTNDFASKKSKIVKTNNNKVLDKTKTEKSIVQELRNAVDSATINNDSLSRSSEIKTTNEDELLENNEIGKLTVKQILEALNISDNNDSIKRISLIVKTYKTSKNIFEKTITKNNKAISVKNHTNVSGQKLKVPDIANSHKLVSRTSKNVTTENKKNNKDLDKNKEDNLPEQEFLNLIKTHKTNDVSGISKIEITNDIKTLKKNEKDNVLEEEFLNAIDIPDTNDSLSRTSDMEIRNYNKVIDKNKIEYLSAEEFLNSIYNNDTYDSVSETSENEMTCENKTLNKNRNENFSGQEFLNATDTSGTSEIKITNDNKALKKNKKDFLGEEFLNATDILDSNDSLSRTSDIETTNDIKDLDNNKPNDLLVKDINEIDIPDTNDSVSRTSNIQMTNDIKESDENKTESFSAQEDLNADDETEVDIDSLFHIDFNDSEGRRVICQLCNKSVTRKCRFSHMSNCHPNIYQRRDKCKLCCTFINGAKMEQHYMTLHAKAPLQCRYCKHDFEQEDALVQHVVACKHKRRATGLGRRSSRRMTECGICHERLQEGSLKRHHNIRHGGMRPVCEHCGQSFSNTYRLDEHYRAKHGYDKFKCSLCTFQTSSTRTLLCHKRKHSGEKPFICHECGATFHAGHLLSQHAKSHRTERLYKCATCSASFKTSNALCGHNRFVHRGVKRQKKRTLDTP